MNFQNDSQLAIDLYQENLMVNVFSFLFNLLNLLYRTSLDSITVQQHAQDK